MIQFNTIKAKITGLVLFLSTICGYIRICQNGNWLKPHVIHPSQPISQCPVFCWNLCRNIEVTDRQKYQVGKGIQISKTTGSIFNNFDHTV